MKKFVVAMLSEEGSSQPSTKRCIAALFALVLAFQSIMCTMTYKATPPSEYMVENFVYVIGICLFGSVLGDALKGGFFNRKALPKTEFQQTTETKVTSTDPLAGQ